MDFLFLDSGLSIEEGSEVVCLELSRAKMGKLIHTHFVTLVRLGIMSHDFSKIVIEDNLSELFFLLSELHSIIFLPGFVLILFGVLRQEGKRGEDDGCHQGCDLPSFHK